MKRIAKYCLLIFIYTSTLSAQTISKEDLQAGDILLYNGNSFLSKLIMLFDGGDYSHTGIYDGENIVEAVEDGVKSFPLEHSVMGVNYVDVYRYKNMDSAQKENVLSVIRMYKYFGDRYSYEQFMLLGVLTLTRKIPLEILSPGVRSFMDRSGTVFVGMLAEGKQPMICSELVYRCYHEADTSGSTKIIIPQNRISHGSLTDIAMKIAMEYLGEASEDITGDLILLKKELKKFKHDYTRADPTVDMDWTEADFVTPSDLQNSPSLIKLGRLKLN